MNWASLLRSLEERDSAPVVTVTPWGVSGRAVKHLLVTFDVVYQRQHLNCFLGWLAVLEDLS